MKMLILYLTIITLCTACFDNVFENNSEVGSRIIIKCLSPNKKHTAVFYLLTGGGAAGWLDLYINVQGSKKEINLSEYYTKVNDENEKISFEWVSSQTLNIVSDRNRIGEGNYKGFKIQGVLAKTYDFKVKPESCFYRHRKT
jgi:hypothetical protein